MKISLPILAPLALAGCLAVQAQPTNTTPAAKPAASTDLLNSWLRSQSPAMSAWDVGGQVRFRYEAKENGGNDSSCANQDFMRHPPAGTFNDNHFLWTRELVHAGYTPCTWFNVFTEARNSTSDGDNRSPSAGDDPFDLQQAYAVLGNPAQFPLTLKVGRQHFSYGDEEILGLADWSNVRRIFDAVKLRWEQNGWWVDAFTLHPVMVDPNTVNPPNWHDYLSGVYAGTTELVPRHEIQTYAMMHDVDYRGSQPNANWLNSPSKTQDICTFGVRLKSLPGKLGPWDYTAEIAAQLGTINPSRTNRLDHQALFARFNGGYTWAKAFGSPRLALEYNYFSGDSNPADDRCETFEPLFPTNHKILGYMELVGQRNVHASRLSGSVKPLKNLTATLDYWMFCRADDHDYSYTKSGTARSKNGYSNSPDLPGFIGSELDLELNYTATSWAALRAGYSHFFVGDYLRQALATSGGSQDADWVYVQTTFSF